MKLKSFVAAGLITVMALGLTACGNQPKNNGANNTPETQKLVLATNAEFPPFEFITEKGKGAFEQYDGIDILIAKEISKDLGREFEISNMEFDSIIASIKTGKADIGLAGMTIDPERLENVDFSEPYWTAVQTIIVSDGNTEIVNAESLKGKKVGVVTGFTGDSVLTKMGSINLQRYKKGIDAVMELKNGKLDAVVIDSPTAKRFIEKFGSLKGVNDDKAFEKEEYAIAVKKGNTELLNKLNETIRRLKQNGDIERFAEEVDSRR